MRVGGDYVDELVVVAVEGTVAVLNSVLIDWLHDDLFFNHNKIAPTPLVYSLFVYSICS